MCFLWIARTDSKRQWSTGICQVHQSKQYKAYQKEHHITLTQMEQERLRSSDIIIEVNESK